MPPVFPRRATGFRQTLGVRRTSDPLPPASRVRAARLGHDYRAEGQSPPADVTDRRARETVLLELGAVEGLSEPTPVTVRAKVTDEVTGRFVDRTVSFTLVP